MANIHVLFAIIIAFLLPSGMGLAASAIPEDTRSAVILSYSRVDEDAYPETNIRIEQFESHVREILSGDYHVLPLPDLIKLLKSGQETPANTIAITFEGGYKSALASAMPLLIQNHIPFTVFYAADKAAQNSDQFLNWQDLAFLAKQANVTLGIMPASFDHLTDKPKEDMRTDINRALVKHRDHFGASPQFFSYPFGEYSTALKQLVSQSGFAAAFTLNSGAASSASDFMALPRFTMTESYGDLERFRVVSRALPLPITDVTPDAPAGALNDHDTPGFTVDDGLQDDLKNLSCYVSGQSAPGISVIGTRIELRPQADFDDRTRINCTLPGPDERWRWLGILLVDNDTDEEEEISPQPDEPQ